MTETQYIKITDAMHITHYSYAGLIGLCYRNCVVHRFVDRRHEIELTSLLQYCERNTKQQLVQKWLKSNPARLNYSALEIKQGMATNGVNVSIRTIDRQRSKLITKVDKVSRIENWFCTDLTRLALKITRVQLELELLGIDANYLIIRKIKLSILAKINK